MQNVAFGLLLILIFVIPWENAIVFDGVGTISRILGLLIFIAWLVSSMATRAVRRAHAIHGLILLFIAWNVMGLWWSVDTDATLKRVFTFLQLGLLSYILWDLCRTRRDWRLALQAYVLGACISLASIFNNFFLQKEAAFSRFAATGFDPNDIGIIFAIGIPAAWYLALSDPAAKGLLRWLNFAYAPLAVMAILLTASRGAFLTLPPIFIYIIWSLKGLNLWRRLVMFTALAAALILVSTFAPPQSFERLSTISAEFAGGDFNARSQIWSAGLNVSASATALGVGGGAFPFAVQPLLLKGEVAHNSYLSVLVECGLVGLLLFLAVLFTAFGAIKGQPPLPRAMWMAVLSVMLIGMFALTWEHRKPIWLFLTLVVISASSGTRIDEGAKDDTAAQQLPPTGPGAAAQG